MRSGQIVSVAGLLCLAGAASGQVVPIGPFTGSHQEGFNRFFNPPFNPCIPDRVFSATGDLCTPGNSGAHTTGGWGFFCTIRPQEGNGLYGSAGGYSEYTFDTPATRFGGYFGTNSEDGTRGVGLQIIMFDENGAEIYRDDNVASFPKDCTWGWLGWEVQGGNAIKRVQVINHAWGGAFIMMDGMQAEYGPPPPPPPPPCYADCDGNGRLDIRDFFCFQAQYAAGCP